MCTQEYDIDTSWGRRALEILLKFMEGDDLDDRCA
jgi:hypothetical protein